ncbi:MAG: TIGR04283 family arsenosugar biosynthesis glycosyltransferase [Halioglobus sp.]|nr:TIGR04283 family arsenosugar biosynthesis glycosyltransferase [Halioglobus sp.]
MTGLVSFVIPTLNESAGIAPLLEALRARFPTARLIVVDGGSADDTVKLAMPRCDALLLCEPGRARQMNLGASVARTRYVVFLHADSLPGVDEHALAAYLASQPAWGFCRVRLSGPQPAFRVIEWFINQRSRLTRIATGDQMLFMRRDVFEACGGFDALPLMEDVACCKRLRRVAAPVIVAEPVLTASRRWEEGGIARTVLRMWALRFAYFAGVSPQRLWRHYYG